MGNWYDRLAPRVPEETFAHDVEAKTQGERGAVEWNQAAAVPRAEFRSWQPPLQSVTRWGGQQSVIVPTTGGVPAVELCRVELPIPMLFRAYARCDVAAPTGPVAVRLRLPLVRVYLGHGSAVVEVTPPAGFQFDGQSVPLSELALIAEFPAQRVWATVEVSPTQPLALSDTSTSNLVTVLLCPVQGVIGG